MPCVKMFVGTVAVEKSPAAEIPLKEAFPVRDVYSGYRRMRGFFNAAGITVCTEHHQVEHARVVPPFAVPADSVLLSSRL